MVILDAIAPQPDVKMKGHDQGNAFKKSDPDKVSFGDIIGITIRQAQFASEEDAFFDADPILAVLDVFDAGVDAGRQDSPDVGVGQIPPTQDDEAIYLEKDEAAGMKPGMTGALLSFGELISFKEPASFDKPISEVFSPVRGENAALLRKEQGYAPTWQMCDDVSEVLDNKKDFADTILLDREMNKTDKPLNQISRLMGELSGRIKDSSNQPEVALTAKMMTNSPSRDVAGSLMEPKETAVFPNGVQNAAVVTSPVPSPTPSLAPQVIQSIQQVAMHLPPRAVHEMTMSLHPQELGKLDISLRMENGQLHVVIKASELGTGQFLQNQMQDLRQSLSDAGINCGDLQMDFGDQAEGQAFEEALRDGNNNLQNDNSEAAFNNGILNDGDADDSSARINLRA
ncbi:MAG: flagellar hook-length control protein FliK [Peptococcaceae bacterium]|nr:flagellar hook-length control protein FliK [Peptococcaceae bacterium]